MYSAPSPPSSGGPSDLVDVAEDLESLVGHDHQADFLLLDMHEQQPSLDSASISPQGLRKAAACTVNHWKSCDPSIEGWGG